MAFYALANQPWPNYTFANEDKSVSILKLLQYVSWIFGFFFVLFGVFSVFMIVTWSRLLYTELPWEKDHWNKVRKDANQILIDQDIRSKPLDEQMSYMNPEQQKEMEKYYRPGA